MRPIPPLTPILQFKLKPKSACESTNWNVLFYTKYVRRKKLYIPPWHLPEPPLNFVIANSRYILQLHPKLFVEYWTPPCSKSGEFHTNIVHSDFKVEGIERVFQSYILKKLMYEFKKQIPHPNEKYFQNFAQCHVSPPTVPKRLQSTKQLLLTHMNTRKAFSGYNRYNPTFWYA